MLRLSSLLAVGFLFGLALASSCSPAAMCSSATCGGCCDSTGKCQSGSMADACGLNGATCGRCGTGTVCQSGECRASNTGGGGGTGGGATGGGTTGGGTTGGGTTGGGTTGGGTTGGGATGGGTTGGGTGNCRTASVPTLTNANLITAEYRSFSGNNGHYNVAVWAIPPLGANLDGVRVEVVYPGDVFPSLPINTSFTNVGYFTCSVCATYNEDCNSMGDCQKTYLAQQGTVSITRADRNASAGRIAGSATNVRFNEWDLMTDRAVPGGGCIQVGSIGPFDVGWNADGGAPPP